MFPCSKCGEQHRSLFNSMEHEKRCNGLVQQILKGDWFKYGTSNTLYQAISDESVRGYVNAKAPLISAGIKVRFNTNVNDLTIVPAPEEGTK